jgi:hypothetical protein
VEKALEKRCLAEEAEALKVPVCEVERGIVCIFPAQGGSLRMETGASATDAVQLQAEEE